MVLRRGTWRRHPEEVLEAVLGSGTRKRYSEEVPGTGTFEEVLVKGLLQGELALHVICFRETFCSHRRSGESASHIIKKEYDKLGKMRSDILFI